jgi:ABC-type multidrug transport system ATPase subunit
LNADSDILEVVDVRLTGRYGRIIFDGINLSLKRGEARAIMGQTGTGKTSLVELITGVRKPVSGSIVLFGRNITKQNSGLNGLRKNIGGVGGLFGLVSYQTVYENLRYPLILRGGRSRNRKRKMEESLNEFGFSAKRDEPAGFLSQGEKTLLMLARAVIADQPFLIVDEPLAGLDSEMTKKVNNTLRRLSLAGHTLLILTTGRGELVIPGLIEHKLTHGRLD